MSKAEFSTILTDREGVHFSITLNRPKKKNALNGVMVDELKSAFKYAAENEDIRTVTLSGAGDAFCSGADLGYLKEMLNYSKAENLQDSLRLAELFFDIYSFPKPVIAVVDGPALAGGCGLASVCDFVLAAPDSKFGYPEVKIGFIAALVSLFLIRQTGERRARELLISGNLIDAEKALEFGLINAVCSHADLEPALRKLKAELCQNSTQAVKKTKEIFSNFIYPDVEAELKKLAWFNAEFRESDDFIEGISAFIEKRKPSWYIGKNTSEDLVC